MHAILCIQHHNTLNAVSGILLLQLTVKSLKEALTERLFLFIRQIVFFCKLLFQLGQQQVGQLKVIANQNDPTCCHAHGDEQIQRICPGGLIDDDRVELYALRWPQFQQVRHLFSSRLLARSPHYAGILAYRLDDVEGGHVERPVVFIKHPRQRFS